MMMPRNNKINSNSIATSWRKLGYPYEFIVLLLTCFVALNSTPATIALEQKKRQNQEHSQLSADQYLRQGIDHYRAGQVSLAIQFWNQAVELYRKQGNLSREGMVLGNLGTAYQAIGQYQKAIDYHQQALNIQQELEDDQLTEKILGNLGNAFAAFGDYDKALDFQQRSLRLAQKIGDRQQIGINLANIGATYFDKGDLAKAIQHYQQSLVITRELKKRKVEGYTLTNLGSAAHNLGDLSEARNHYQQGLKIAQEIGDRWLEAEALASIGFVSEGLNDFEQAMDYYDQGLALFQKIGARQEQATTLNNRAHTLLKWQKHTEAEQNLRQAIQILDDLRNDLDQTAQVSIFDTQVRTYNLLQQVLIAQDQPQAALEMSEHGRARALITLLSQRQASETDVAAAMPPPLAQIREIARSQQATLVEYSIIPDNRFIHRGKQRGRAASLYIWVVKPNGAVTFHSVDFASLKTSLKTLVTDSRQAIGARDRSSVVFSLGDGPTPTKRLQQLEQLHQLLIQPIAHELPKDPQERVIFIPEGPLFLVPFPALRDQQGTYLIEKHTIQTAPAIQLLQLTHQRKQSILADATAKEVLVVGNPAMPSVSPRIGHPPEQLSSLPGAEREATGIAHLFDTKAVLGREATETAITSLLPKARIVHLATHGLLDDFAGLGVPGAIALAPSGTEAANDGLLTASEILNLQLNADLVVLSACNTGQGEITGDGVIGLSRSLIVAGVPSVIVSLWAVPDTPTVTFMLEFYRTLQLNPNKAQALRQAMLAMIKKYPMDPKKWAAFTLIGET